MTVRQLFTILLFIGLFLMTLRPIADPDFWWHLRTGQLISQTGSIPHSDPFSFTNNGKPWIAHEWLSELFFYGLYRIGSYAALILTFSTIITASFLFAYLRCPAETRPYIAGFALFLGAIATAPTWGVRPQMISLFVTSLFLYLLDRYRKENSLKYVLLLPLITLVWVNVHAGYFLGLAVVGLYIIGGLLEILRAVVFKPEGIAPPSIKSMVILCSILGACLLTTLINPNGIKIIFYPFQTLTSPSMQQLIQEWFSPDFHLLQWQPLAWMILLLIGVGMIGKKSISITNILLTLILGYAALRSMRNIPLFVIVAIPVLAEQTGSIIKIRSTASSPSRLFKWISPVLLTCFILITSLRFVQVNQEQASTEASSFPKTAVDWILKNKPQSNLYNAYGWGGYLIWRLYPTYSVFIDGRADVYGDTFIFNFMSIQNAEPGWENRFDSQSVKTVLIEPHTPLANLLRESVHWKIAFEDNLSIIFVHD
jgi:hypothetical protein